MHIHTHARTRTCVGHTNTDRHTCTYTHMQEHTHACFHKDSFKTIKVTHVSLNMCLTTQNTVRRTLSQISHVYRANNKCRILTYFTAGILCIVCNISLVALEQFRSTVVEGNVGSLRKLHLIHRCSLGGTRVC